MRRATGQLLIAISALNIEFASAPATARDEARPPEGIVGDCIVTDGDTIRCGRERIRLLGIDAPELPGHCRPGRACAPGDPFASTASLGRAMSANMRINRVGVDAYGRTLALVTGSRGDLSCWQLAQQQAIYRPDWDDGLLVRRACPAAVLAHRFPARKAR